MKKVLKINGFVLPVLYVMLFTGIFFTTLAVSSSLKNKVTNEAQEKIVEDSPKTEEVIKVEDNNMLYPYTDNNVKVIREYYDYTATKEEGKNAIVYYNGTYMQNTGLDFGLENPFDVVSVLKGTVADVKDDENIGKIITIKHDNNFVSTYESLSDVSVKKGDVVDKGVVIGKSGTNKIDASLGNHLHFELYYGGELVNPKLYLGKTVKGE